MPRSFDMPHIATVRSETEELDNRLSIINRYRHQNSLTGYAGPFGLEAQGEEWVIFRAQHPGYVADRSRAHSCEEIARGTLDQMRNAIALIEMGTV